MLVDANPDESWAKLATWLKHRRLALILGAGVSVGNGLPSWPALIQQLAARVGYNLHVTRSLSLDIPRQFSLIRDWYEKNSPAHEWSEIVREVLYADYRKQLVKADCPLQPTSDGRCSPALVAYFESANPVLSAVVRLCAIPSRPGPVEGAKSERSGEYFAAAPPLLRRNPRVAAVLTYNLDSLLQEYDRARHGSPRLLRTIERASKECRPNKIPVYHLHGYIRPLASVPDQEAKDRIVLTEQEYHDWTDDPLSFGTSAALQTLRENVCLFIGCSMSDQLMRRALRRWYRERESAIASEYPDDADAMSKVKRWRRHFAVILRKQSPDENVAIDSDLRLSGVWPAWVNDFDHDLVERLVKLGEFLETRAAADLNNSSTTGIA